MLMRYVLPAINGDNANREHAAEKNPAEPSPPPRRGPERGHDQATSAASPSFSSHSGLSAAVGCSVRSICTCA